MAKIEMHLTVRQAWWVTPALHASWWIVLPVVWALSDKQIGAYADWVAGLLFRRGFHVGLEE